MHYDAVIIGAGYSGLAAGIRLAYFDRRVCIVEKHYAYGGLNSYYTLKGRDFDVGLHAVTNYVPPSVRAAPLPKLLRQLRLRREDLDLCEQRFSEVRFPGRRLRFTNDVNYLIEEVGKLFPHEVDGFCRLLSHIRAYDDIRLDHPYRSTREVLAAFLYDETLTDMLLCPIMYYGNAQAHDMDFTQFVTIFRSILLEGLARPRGGTRTILKTLVKKFRGCGGRLRMNCGVRCINVENDRVTGLTLDSGRTLTAEVVISSIGWPETEQLCCGPAAGSPSGTDPGRLSFYETILVLDELPQRLGMDATIIFFNEAERFTYARPGDLVDLRSGVICCPSNYEGHEDMKEGVFRLTWLANFDRWAGLDEAAYTAAKQARLEDAVRRAEQYLPNVRDHIVFVDMFTPRTIQRFTGRLGGAVYGVPGKRRDGRTQLKNLFICGTDQGFHGIIGAMLSGITIANLHVLSKPTKG
jgi:phytoene dehydrogenase-like protein